MASVNKVIIVGRLGRDPEVRATQSGDRIANLSVATSERWTDKGTGEVKERTEWHRVSVFNERASDFAEKYLRKGALVYVEGQLQTRKWKDQNGEDRYTTEIVISRFRGELVSLDSGPRDGGDGDRTHASAKPMGGGPGLDEDVPFAPLRMLP